MRTHHTRRTAEIALGVMSAAYAMVLAPTYPRVRSGLTSGRSDRRSFAGSGRRVHDRGMASIDWPIMAAGGDALVGDLELAIVKTLAAAGKAGAILSASQLTQQVSRSQTEVERALDELEAQGYVMVGVPARAGIAAYYMLTTAGQILLQGDDAGAEPVGHQPGELALEVQQLGRRPLWQERGDTFGFGVCRISCKHGCRSWRRSSRRRRRSMSARCMRSVPAHASMSNTRRIAGPFAAACQLRREATPSRL